MTTFKLLLLPGDGIGPEVMAEVSRLIDWVNAPGLAKIETETDLVGGCAYDAHGEAISDATMEKALAADAVMLGAVGGPKWDGVPYDQRPEAGLLRLRKDLELFANLRPAICYPALADASSLKRELVEGLDIMIVRELTGGVYFGEPKTITDLGNGQKRAIDTQVYDTYEIERIAAVAFELARKRRNLVHSAEKRNVMKTGVLWNEVVTRLHKERYSDVTLQHILADNCAMQLVRAAETIRRHRHRQSVRRHAVRRSGDGHGLARHAAVGLARRCGRAGPPPRALRAGAWLGARHRRQGRGQPDRHHRELRHVPALFLRSRRDRRQDRGRDLESAGPGFAHRRHQARRLPHHRHARDGRRHPRRARQPRREPPTLKPRRIHTRHADGGF